VQRLRLASINPGLSPSARLAITPALTAAQNQVTEIQKLQYGAAAKEEERVKAADRARIAITNSGLNADEQKPFLAAADADPNAATEAVKQAVELQKERRHHLAPATPQQLAGFPPGTRADVDPVTGKLENLYNPDPARLAWANNALAKQRLGIERGRYALEVQKVANDEAAASGLSPEAKDIAATVYLKSGVLPTGMGKQAVALRQDIMNRAAEIAKVQGMSPDQVVAKRATMRADQSSLANLTKTTDAVTAFENTAAKHFDNALELAKKGGVPTNAGPWINNWVQTGSIQVGNAKTPPYLVSLLTGADEYAKVLDGATGAAGSSVNSRAAAAKLFASGYNYNQIKAAVDAAKGAMDAKKAEYGAQIKRINDRLAAPGNGGGAGGDHIPTWNPKTQKFE